MTRIDHPDPVAIAWGCALPCRFDAMVFAIREVDRRLDVMTKISADFLKQHKDVAYGEHRRGRTVAQRNVLA